MNTRASLMTVLFVTVLTFPLMFIEPVHAAPGDLDPLFGYAGKVVTDTTQSAGFVRRTRIQPDGKIVTLGHSFSDCCLPNAFFITRNNQDGSVDTSFGTNGVKTFTYPFLGYDYLNDFIALPDGKIMITGARYYYNARGDVFLYRLNSDGSVDGTFGDAGFITTTVGDSSGGRKIARQNDGKIIVAGFTDSGLAVLRYNVNGQLDSSFGTNGIAFFSINTDSSYIVFGSGFVEEAINDLLIQPDGKILVGASSQWDFALARLDADGHPDNSFGSNGLILTDVINRPNYLNGIALQPDGKIVVNGLNQTVYEEGLESSALLRYNTNGTIDQSFGANGVVLIAEPDQTSRGLASALAIQPDGKILTAGMKDGEFAIARYKNDGTIDAQFGSAGVLTTPVGTTTGLGTILSLAWQADGKLVAAGSLREDTHKVGLIRYLGDSASSQPSSTISGRVLTPNGGGLRNAGVILIGPQGVVRHVTTNPLGYYSIDNIDTGLSYVVSVSSKRYRFASRDLEINTSLTNVDFVGIE